VPPRIRRAPRATQLMIELFRAVSGCGQLIDYWDIASRQDGVLLRVRSRQRFSTEQEAQDTARAIAEQITPRGYDVRDITAGTRSEANGATGWRALVEILVG
jgi:hypothetical protein